MNSEALKDLVLNALDEMKANDVVVLDVRGATSVTDYMVIASGRSDRHVKSLAGHLVETAKKAGEQPIGVEGERVGDWVLVDLNGVVAHMMMPETRMFYNLEKLWGHQSDEAVVSE